MGIVPGEIRGPSKLVCCKPNASAAAAAAAAADCRWPEYRDYDGSCCCGEAYTGKACENGTYHGYVRVYGVIERGSLAPG